MRKVLAIAATVLLLLLFFGVLPWLTSCAQPQPGNTAPVALTPATPAAKPDTVFVADTTCLLQLQQMQLQLTRLQASKDSIGRLLFLSNYKVEKVRYYLNITLRDRSQDKFLKGWVRRAIE